MKITHSSRGGETTRGAGDELSLTSAGRVTQAGGTTFSHVHTLAPLPGTTLAPNVWFWVKNDYNTKLGYLENPVLVNHALGKQ